MAILLSELQEMHDNLQRAYYKGELRVRFADGREVQYSSADDMRKKITDLEDDIAQASGQVGETHPWRSTSAETGPAARQGGTGNGTTEETDRATFVPAASASERAVG